MKLTVAFIPMLLGIILHEVAHGAAALRCGDPTARMLGRLSVNPLPHIDPMGLAMFAFTALCTPFVFGWAKPVPVNPRYFRNFRRDMILVSAAGPLANFLLAVLFAVLLKLMLFLPGSVLASGPVPQFMAEMFLAGIQVNISLAWFNLIPVPPLDGSKILACVLPDSAARALFSIGRFGFLIIAVILASGTAGTFLSPIIRGSVRFLLTTAGL